MSGFLARRGYQFHGLSLVVARALFGEGSFAVLYLYAIALLGQKPLMPVM